MKTKNQIKNRLRGFVNSIENKYPHLDQWINDLRLRKGKDLPRCPSWCFLPIDAWTSMARTKHGFTEDIPPDDIIKEIINLQIAGTWQYSQGIYSIDNSLLPALIDTEIKGDFPIDVLHRLPEYALYISTPNCTIADLKIDGFFVTLEFNILSQDERIVLYIDREDPFIIRLPLKEITISEAIESTIEENFEVDKKEFDRTVTFVSAIISILLYICSDAPEIEDLERPNEFPKRLRPKKTKFGWKIFPQSKPIFWDVGKGIGKKLYLAEQEDARLGSAKRTHLRRGHWHGFWTGKRDAERRLKYNWIPPLIAGGKNEKD